MAPNFSARRTPPNVQKIPAGEGIYIQTKHKQTTLRSSRDQQNFPQLQSSDVPVPLKVTSPIPQILSPNSVSKHRSPSPPLDDTRSMGTFESGYKTETASTISDVSSGSYSSKLCVMCRVAQKSAALVPCGHSSFCYTCALNISALPDARCPICATPVKMALNIK